MTFSKTHAKEAMPKGSDTQHDTWVKTANKALKDGKTEAQAKALATKVAENVKESVTPLQTDAFLLLAEVGKVLSSANEDHVRQAHGHLSDMLTALDGKAKATESRRERSLRTMGLEEAGSESASDASRGAYLLGQLIDLMGDEADEPDQLAQLTRAHDELSGWIKAEVAEIGTPDDEDETPAPYWGWEAKATRADGASVFALEEAASAPLLDRSTLIGLAETAVRRDGTATVKIITPGWGSSGYYSKDLLERRGPEVFKAGTQMYWNHPTRTEESDRPERDLRDLAAKLVTDAVYQEKGPSGPGLYADALIYENFRQSVDEMAGDIGVSIRAMGTGHRGEAEGQTGPIVDDLVEAISVDFVTVAGRGGEVLPLFEAARERAHARPQTPPTNNPPTEDPQVDLKEAEALQAKVQRQQERIVLGEAKDVINSKVAEATKLPLITRTRLMKTLAEGTIPTVDKDGEVELDKAKLEEAITKAIADEVDYVAKLAEANGAGSVRGLGVEYLTEDGQHVDDGKIATSLEEGFASLGLSESASKLAAAGRK